jgi:hypothetical protein
MSWGTYQRIGVLSLLVLGLAQGCSAQRPHRINDLPRSNTLFTADRSASLATQFGRAEWPAVYGAYESPQETVFLEYYRDFQSDAALEGFYPYRSFTSYRTGTQQR